MQTKHCKKCAQTLPIAEFHERHDLKVKPSYYTVCNTCTSKRGAAYYEANRSRHNATVNQWYQSTGRFMRYGLTAEDYQQALESQGGKCKLCEASEPGGKGAWCIDHEHSDDHNPRNSFRLSGRFRGLLCHRCNVALGHYEKLLSRIGLQRIKQYLNQP